MDGASSDENNLRKLLRERIDVAVIDREVMGISIEPALRNQAGQLAFHPHWLASCPLRVCAATARVCNLSWPPRRRTACQPPSYAPVSVTICASWLSNAEPINAPYCDVKYQKSFPRRI